MASESKGSCCTPSHADGASAGVVPERRVEGRDAARVKPSRTRAGVLATVDTSGLASATVEFEIVD